MKKRAVRRKLSALSFFLFFAISAAQTPGFLSPAQQKIALLEKAIAAKPGEFQLFNELAGAMVLRARETEDSTFYNQAETALQQSFRLAPGNFDGRKAAVLALLGKHEFAKALPEARALNKLSGDDVAVYGMIADADIGLGDYKDAEQAAQWMLDLRANNPQSLLHGAALRELFGDPDGAIELMTTAYQKAPPNDTEERAWILTRAAEMQLRAGRLSAASAQLASALSIFPDYPRALRVLAEIRTREGNYKEAVSVLRKLPAGTRNLYALGEALAHDRQSKAAALVFAEFERKARAEIGIPLNANRGLVLYYAGPGLRPAEALRIARIEFSRRHDVCTLDAFAWALFVNGQYAQARERMDAALSVGIRDAGFFEHAARIAAKLHDNASAAKYSGLARMLR